MYTAVGHTSTDINLAYTAVGYPRPISLPAYTTVGYASSEIDLAYTTIGYARLISLLAYTTDGYASSETDLVYTCSHWEHRVPVILLHEKSGQTFCPKTRKMLGHFRRI